MVFDAVAILSESTWWMPEDATRMSRWASEYILHLQSAHCHNEASQENNHGTLFDVQYAAFLKFLGRCGIASAARSMPPPRVCSYDETSRRRCTSCCSRLAGACVVDGGGLPPRCMTLPVRWTFGGRMAVAGGGSSLQTMHAEESTLTVVRVLVVNPGSRSG